MKKAKEIPQGDEKSQVNYRLTGEFQRLLGLMSTQMGISPAGVLEVLVREGAERRKIK